MDKSRYIEQREHKEIILPEVNIQNHIGIFMSNHYKNI